MSNTRLIFFALLLANVAFFAWRQNAGPADGHEPQRMQQQLDPDKITLILPDKPAAPPQPNKTSESKPTDKTADKPTPTTSADPAPAPSKTETTPKPEAATKHVDAPLLCKSFGGFTPESAKTAQAAISSSSPTAKVALITTKDSASYWVHIPPQSNKAGADKKIGELKELGVDDSFVISDEGPNKWAISLGLFKSKDMADSYLQKLTKQGVRSAKIEVRDKGTEKVRIEVSAPAEALGVLAREVKPLAGATLGDCKPTDVAKN